MQTADSHDDSDIYESPRNQLRGGEGGGLAPNLTFFLCCEPGVGQVCTGRAERGEQRAAKHNTWLGRK